MSHDAYPLLSEQRRRRVWFIKPELHWYGWGTVIPFFLGGDEFFRRTIMLGWTVTGRLVIVVGRPQPPKLSQFGGMGKV